MGKLSQSVMSHVGDECSVKWMVETSDSGERYIVLEIGDDLCLFTSQLAAERIIVALQQATLDLSYGRCEMIAEHVTESAASTPATDHGPYKILSIDDAGVERHSHVFSHLDSAQNYARYLAGIRRSIKIINEAGIEFPLG